MTLSGGECLMFPEFSRALFYACKTAGISTAVEASCFASQAVIDLVLEYADIALLDIKHMDSEIHKRLTGISNEIILNNIRHIYRDLKKRVILRLPVIPGCNDSEENITAVAKFAMTELGPDVPVNLLPYHRLGESKSESLGQEITFSARPPDSGHMQKLFELLQSYGIEAKIGG